MSLQEDLKNAEKSEMANSGGGWYKFSEGGNRFRILATPVAIFEDYAKGMCYEGCGFQGAIKHLTFILDGKDGKIKLFKMPHTIFKWLVSLESDPDWAFEGFPMPYDVTINAKGAGKKEVEYSSIASPKRDTLSEAIMIELGKKGKLEDVIAKLQSKSKEKNGLADYAPEGGVEVIEG